MIQSMLRKACLLAAFLLLAGRTWAQKVQNSDIEFLVSVNAVGAQTVGDVTVPGATGVTQSFCYGYQIARKSAASLWAELFTVFASGRYDPKIVSYAWWGYLPGLRLMAPVHARVSLFGVAGAGVGSFRPPNLVVDGKFYPGTGMTWHGVFEVGGGVDLRLTRMLSLRADYRDFITGRGLSSVEGRHHPLILGGIGVHF
jgi:hypothetical protein